MLADVAVVIPTVLRPSLLRAVRSVFDQSVSGHIQILIGVDRGEGDAALLDILSRERPANVTLTILDLGYSTSRRHGGFYSNCYSGALRTILSFAANSKYVAYLDDDDWWGRQHLSSLLYEIAHKDWAFSYRWMVDRETGWPICRDEWDSMGPEAGINRQRFGGFVSPSSLMLNKDTCHYVLPYWSQSPFADGTGEDRLVFRELLKHPSWAASGQYTCYCELPREVQEHHHHAREFAARHISWISDPAQIDIIVRLAEEASTALKRHDIDATIGNCRRVLALNPHHAQALHCLALTSWQIGNISEAYSLITHAMEVNDHDPNIIALWSQITESHKQI